MYEMTITYGIWNEFSLDLQIYFAHVCELEVPLVEADNV